jgi:hypothetical protein
VARVDQGLNRHNGLAGPSAESDWGRQLPVAGDVLRHQEDPENHTYLGRRATVPDGLEAFDEFLHRGKRLEANLLTENGQPTELALGIVTVHDIPRLRRAIRE